MSTDIARSHQSTNEPAHDLSAHDPSTNDSSRAGAAGHALLESLSQPEPTVRDHRKFGLDKVIFGVTAIIAVGFVVWGFAGTSSLSTTSTDALTWVMTNTGWAFVLTASLFVVSALWLAGSRYGTIPLGADDEKPEFRTISWVAMMFSAGMGIGLMFYGVAEPLFHFVSPPPATVDANTSQAVETAMATTLFHWTLHPWAIYATVGVAIAYSTFRKGRSQLISAVFSPLLGRHSQGPAGKLIDILAIFATLFGSAASLGLGALQIGSGLEFNGWFGTVGTPILVAIIAVLTVAFVASAVSGIAKGIQWLSNINMVLAVALALFVFVVGPTVFILDVVPTAMGDYVRDLPEMASRTNASGDQVSTWLASWTVFYWAWWISWTPFVGMFIARISRGRTIREFVTGVLLVPSIVSLVWFAIFGGAAISEQRDSGRVAPDGVVDFEGGSLFTLLEQYPIASVTSVLVMVLVGIFFVSGADAASIVMGTLSEKGTIEPSKPTVIFWGVLTGGVAAVMLLAGAEGDDTSAALTGLKNITIVSALPFMLVMVGLCVALAKDLRHDPMMLRTRRCEEIVEAAVIQGVTRHGDDFALKVEPVNGTPPGTGRSDTPEVESGEQARQGGT